MKPRKFFFSVKMGYQHGHVPIHLKEQPGPELAKLELNYSLIGEYFLTFHRHYKSSFETKPITVTAYPKSIWSRAQLLKASLSS